MPPGLSALNIMLCPVETLPFYCLVPQEEDLGSSDSDSEMDFDSDEGEGGQLVLPMAARPLPPVLWPWLVVPCLRQPVCLPPVLLVWWFELDYDLDEGERGLAAGRDSSRAGRATCWLASCCAFAARHLPATCALGWAAHTLPTAEPRLPDCHTSAAD